MSTSAISARKPQAKKSMKQDLFEQPDFYQLDSLLTEEQKTYQKFYQGFREKGNLSIYRG